jgi:hypothetical protein
VGLRWSSRHGIRSTDVAEGVHVVVTKRHVPAIPPHVPDDVDHLSLKRSLLVEGSGKSERDAQRFYAIARGSALECAAILDAFGALGFVHDTDLTAPLELLERIVSMLTRMARG